jgi:glycosyltransferase involved in cell wall biosynthesis/SAM-dependent methyltransferase
MLELQTELRDDSEVERLVEEPSRPAISHHIDLMWCDIHGVFVKGWAYGFSRAPETLVLFSGEFETVVSNYHERADLLSFFPDFPEITSRGFSAYLACDPFKPIFLAITTIHERVVIPLTVPAHVKAAFSTAPIENAPLQRFASEMRKINGTVLELGARKVSPITSDHVSLFLPECRFLTNDIHPAQNIDIVADAHFLSDHVEHGSIDGVFSVAVMEHLAAPWLVAAEINRVLKIGGLTLQVLPQTWPVHEMPNDFWRMTDEGLKALFAPELGFEILDSGMETPMAIYPSLPFRHDAFLEMPFHPGFGNSFVLARKVREIADASVRWPMARNALSAISQSYPRHDEAKSGDGSSGISEHAQPLQPCNRLPLNKVVTVAAVVPLYNGAPFIEAAVESIIAQTDSAEEIIIVDDGSTDEGPDIVRELAKRYPIKLLTKLNGGQSSARNFGMAQTHCSHIALLDQDDIWHPHHIALLKKPFIDLENRKLGFVYGNLDRIDKSGRVVSRNFLNEIMTPHPKMSIRECVSQDMFILPGATLISKQAWRDVGGFDEKLSGYEDDDFFFRLFLAGYESEYLKDNSVMQWRIYPNSTSFSPRMAKSRMIYFRKLMEFLPDEPDLNLYWARDAFGPRFLVDLRSELIHASKMRDINRVRRCWSDLKEVFPVIKGHLRRRLKLIGPIIDFMHRTRFQSATRFVVRRAVRTNGERKYGPSR